MHIHILGICGTFMGSLAQLGVEKGLKVTGCDANVYPPMSTQLQQAGIEIVDGFELSQLKEEIDLYVIGNSMSRGNPLVEEILNRGLPYTSGPQFFADHILPGKWVLGVAGTHGKTTTSSMLAWILEYAGFEPGFLIGGVPGNFSVSARLGSSDFFVVEADEYDSAFFDKRSKFVHYKIRTAILNNLEFDHADIFDSLADIQKQFHHLVRTVAGNGQLIYPAEEENLQQVLNKGSWSPTQTFGSSDADSEWQAKAIAEDCSKFLVLHQGEVVGEVEWLQCGNHNMMNGLAAIIAARHVGIAPELAAEALNKFEGVKRRMEVLAEISGVTVYDDFAHHPTAIATTLEGLRNKVGEEQIIAVIEPRSNTMKMGVHRDRLAGSVELADRVFWFQPDGADFSLQEIAQASRPETHIEKRLDQLLDEVCRAANETRHKKVHIVIMSNGGFGGFHQKLVSRLAN